jgi:DNA polymerase III subunit delta'
MSEIINLENPLVGHDRNRQRLRKLHQDGSASGSYLFSGQEGIGKKMTAIWFARIANCTGKNPPCGECNSCKKIEKGLHPDVRIISRAKEKTGISIDQVRREIVDEANYKPFEGKFKVFIIDDAHLMNDQSQNSLLKVLEEPGSSVIIILVTSRPNELLPTVLSRCREFRFFPLSPAELETVIMRMPNLDRERVKILAVASAGSPGRAAVLASDETFWKRRQQIFNILDRLPDGRLDDVLDFADSFQITRANVQGLEHFFETILSWLRDVLVIRSGAEESGLLNSDFRESVQKAAYFYSSEDLVSIQELIIEERKLVFENNLNFKMALQRILIRILRAGSVAI